MPTNITKLWARHRRILIGTLENKIIRTRWWSRKLISASNRPNNFSKVWRSSLRRPRLLRCSKASLLEHFRYHRDGPSPDVDKDNANDDCYRKLSFMAGRCIWRYSMLCVHQPLRINGSFHALISIRITKRRVEECQQNTDVANPVAQS